MAKIIIIIPSFVWEQNETKRRTERRDCVKINHRTLHWDSSWILSKLSQFSSLLTKSKQTSNKNWKLHIVWLWFLLCCLSVWKMFWVVPSYIDSPVSSTSHHQELCPSFIQFVKMNKIDLHNHFQEFKYAHKHNFPLSHHSWELER